MCRWLPSEKHTCFIDKRTESDYNKRQIKLPVIQNTQYESLLSLSLDSRCSINSSETKKVKPYLSSLRANRAPSLNRLIYTDRKGRK